MNTKSFLHIIFCLLVLSGCDRQAPVESAQKTNKFQQDDIDCAADNAGLILPAGFCARIIADNLGFIRHFTVKNPAELYITQRNRRLNLGGLLAAKDTDADGYMDAFEQISEEPGMGIGIWQEHLYFASENTLYRYDLTVPPKAMMASRQTLVPDFPIHSRHAGKPFTFDNKGHIYINVGAPSNACQITEDQLAGPGEEPCGQLEKSGGIWRFRPELGQTFLSGERYASGIRNAYALDWHHELDTLFIVEHGRDRLHELWPKLYDMNAGAELPAEVMLQVEEDSIHAWPYCYFDPVRDVWVTAPEYGGDGEHGTRCTSYSPPVIAFPAHYGPNDMLFYHGQQFPDEYRQGAFIAFHGSYNRGSHEQVGYQVIFVPYKEGKLDPSWRVFADGFAGTGVVSSPDDADYRPTGLALDSEGSLYVSDSVQGRIWRIKYRH